MIPQERMIRAKHGSKELLFDRRDILPDEWVYVCCDFGVDLF
jgi:hypothetical protein